MTRKQDQGARRKSARTTITDPAFHYSNLAKPLSQLLILISIYYHLWLKQPMPLGANLALRASASRWLTAAPSMRVFDALYPHNKGIVLFRLGMDKFLDGHA